MEPAPINPLLPSKNPGTSFLEQCHIFQKGKDGQPQFSPDSLGRLHRETTWTLGESRAIGFLTRWGYSCGQSAAFKSPFVGQMTGLAKLARVEYSISNDEYIIETTESCEVEGNIPFNLEKVKKPQCWIMAGFLTGFVSGNIGQAYYFIETDCIHKGDPTCRFFGKKRSKWSYDKFAELSLYEEDNMAIELADACEQLKLTKDRYQNLFEQTNVPIFIVDPDSSHILDLNIAAQKLTGYRRSELTAMSIFDLAKAEFHNEIADLMKQISTEGGSAEQEIDLIQRNEEVRNVLHTAQLITFGGQRVMQIAMRDITDLKSSVQKEKDLQDQLLRSERLSSIGRLAASVAHELKNPLGAIKNALYYIQTSLNGSPEVEKDPQLKEMIKVAEQEIDSSVLIIGELLDFSRVIHLNPRKTNLNELLEQIPMLLNIPNTVEIEMDLDPSLPHPIVDRDRMKQVFSNIVSNGIQAMSERGIIRITSSLEFKGGTGEENGGVPIISISIKDTGQGIDSKHLAKIFEPLFTTKTSGTGLGLAITNNIVKKHGGTILVTSQKGKGTRFTIKLPLQPPPDKEDGNARQ